MEKAEQFLREEGYKREEEQAGYILTVSEMIELLDKYVQSRKADVSGEVPTIEITHYKDEDAGACPPMGPDWIASWKLFPGMVVSAATREKAIDELMTSIRVQLLHDLSLREGNK